MRVLILASAVSLLAADLHAQVPVPPCGAGGGSRIVRSLVGGTIGGWLGFVGYKIRVSDWNDASRGASGARLRNQATLGGVAIGAAVGALIGGGSRSCAPPSTDARMGRAPITKEEIVRSGQTGSVYDLVYAIRRNWLNRRGVAGFGESSELQINVYLDNSRVGYIDELRKIPAASIETVRFYDPAEATFRWGGGSPLAAIEVLSTSK